MCVRLPQALLALEPGQGVGGDAPGSVPRGSCICAGPILSLGHPLSQAWGPQTAAVLWGFQVRCLGLLPRAQGLTGTAQRGVRTLIPQGAGLSPSRLRWLCLGTGLRVRRVPAPPAHFHAGVFRVPRVVAQPASAG